MSKKGYETGSRNVFKDLGVPNAPLVDEIVEDALGQRLVVAHGEAERSEWFARRT